jgi:hypothetical protein
MIFIAAVYIKQPEQFSRIQASLNDQEHTKAISCVVCGSRSLRASLTLSLYVSFINPRVGIFTLQKNQQDFDPNVLSYALAMHITEIKVCERHLQTVAGAIVSQKSIKRYQQFT